MTVQTVLHNFWVCDMLRIPKFFGDQSHAPFIISPECFHRVNPPKVAVKELLLATRLIEQVVQFKELVI